MRVCDHLHPSHEVVYDPRMSNDGSWCISRYICSVTKNNTESESFHPAGEMVREESQEKHAQRCVYPCNETKQKIRM